MFTNKEDMLAVYKDHLAATIKHQRALDAGTLGSPAGLMNEVLTSMYQEKAGMAKVLGLSSEEMNALQAEVEATIKVEAPAQ
jgi:hypothetical protein